jgi:hypothetical protein
MLATCDALLALVLTPCFPASLLPSRPSTSLSPCFPPRPSTFLTPHYLRRSASVSVSLSSATTLWLDDPAWQQVMTRFIACQSAAVGKVSSVPCLMPLSSRPPLLQPPLPSPPFPPSLSQLSTHAHTHTHACTHTPGGHVIGGALTNHEVDRRVGGLACFLPPAPN